MTVLLSGWIADRPTARRTMERMRDAVRKAVRAPAVIEMARKVVAAAAPRDEIAQARAIRTWAVMRFRFVKDPDGDEYLTSPEFLLAKIAKQGFVQGDCDDAAILTAALGIAVGIPARFVAVAFTRNGPYQHVFTVLYPFSRALGIRRPIEMDITRPPEIPQLPRFARRLVFPV